MCMLLKYSCSGEAIISVSKMNPHFTFALDFMGKMGHFLCKISMEIHTQDINYLINIHCFAAIIHDELHIRN